MDQGSQIDLVIAPRDAVLEQLEKADALRDQRAWGAAAEAYRRYLAARPDDWGIRVQLGHCLKEAGDPGAALGIYREVERRVPEHSDIHLQLGHALKLLGRVEEAHGEYLRALELDLESGPAKREVAALSQWPMPADERSSPAATRLQLVVDISDLMAYFRANRAPTGIQRVQLNVTAQMLTAPPDDVVPSVCTFDESSGFWREVGRESFLALWRLSRTGADCDDPAWREALATAFREVAEGFDFPFVPGACLVNLGTSWWIRDYFLRVRHVQRHRGVRYVPFVHDCIPLIVPEHCERALVREFAQWFASLALHADALLCNSCCTEADVGRQIVALFPNRALPPSTVIPLDADLRQEFGALATPGMPDPLLAGPDESFVLWVGTIESRKDHLLVFRAWLELIQRHGHAGVPRLICVGKHGWLAGPALALLAATPGLAARVAIVHDVPDTVLAGLYERCLFTLYNSHYEGWGLPVTESLSYGRVPLIPRHSALVEAGAAGAVFFAPGDANDLLAKLETLLFDSAAREAAEARIAAGPRLRGWGEIKDQMLAALRAVPRRAEPPRIALRTGQVAELRRLGALKPSLAMALADTARCGLGWHPLEPWGVWTRPGIALLSLPLEAQREAAAEATLRLHLGCVAPPRDLVVSIQLGAGTEPVELLAEAGMRFTCVLDIPPGLSALEIAIDNGAEGVALDAPDGRRVGIGLTGLVLCRRDDILARLDFLEHQRIPSDPPPRG